MLKNVIVLPDGRELSAGAEQECPLMSVTLTESVNDNEELTLGAAVADILEVKINTGEKSLDLTAGDEVILYKENDSGVRRRMGVFVLEKPTRPTAVTMNLTGYDYVIKLDKDVGSWLKDLSGWPYRLIDFAGMVCQACGLELVTTSIPNEDFLVYQLSGEVTGRQLMRWIGEACGRFCRANADGKIELDWYAPANVSINAAGDCYYLQNSLSYEEYQVELIDAVQLRLADSESGTLWPSVAEGANSYIISGNPLLLARVTDDLLPVLQTIKDQLPQAGYRPCSISIPATLDIRAGNTVHITDKNGVAFTTYVMTKVQTGQKDTLECTGSPRRDSSVARNNQTEQEKTAALKSYADTAANSAKAYTDAENEKLNQLELLKRLTKEWVDEGIYLDEEGRLAINASAILTGVLAASLIQSGVLQSKDGKTYFNLETGEIVTVSEDGSKMELQDATIRLWDKEGHKRFELIQQWEALPAYGTYGIYFYGSAGQITGGIESLSEKLWILTHDFDKGMMQGYRTAWKEINGVKTLIGYEYEEPDVQSVATLYSGTLNSGSVSFTGEYSQYVIVGYTTSNQCKVSLTIPAVACDGSLFQLFADGAWVSFNMTVDALTVSRVSNGGAITGIYGII